MDAIIYTSNSGFTANYATMLSYATNLPVWSLDQAKEHIGKGRDVIYLGWLMAGNVKGLKKTAAIYKVRAVCAVGMAAPGVQTPESIAKQNKLADSLSVFYLQGGFDLAKLHGIYKIMMKMMAKGTIGKLVAKPDKTAEETEMLDMLQHGGDRVKEENLAPVLAWLDKQG